MDKARSKVRKSTTRKTTRRKSAVKKSDSALSICPVGGAGWCPYPFSAKQLEKRLKKIQETDQEKQLQSAHK